MKVILAITFLFVPLACTAYGTYFLIRCLRNYLRAKATYRWPSTHGIVVSSEIKTLGSSHNCLYYPVITYEYELEGKTRRSTQLKLGDEFLTDGSHFQAERVTRDFPVGRSVDVNYNPRDLGDTVLVEGIFRTSFWLGIPIAIFFYIMAAIAYMNPGFPFIWLCISPCIT